MSTAVKLSSLYAGTFAVTAFASSIRITGHGLIAGAMFRSTMSGLRYASSAVSRGHEGICDVCGGKAKSQYQDGVCGLRFRRCVHEIWLVNPVIQEGMEGDGSDNQLLQD